MNLTSLFDRHIIIDIPTREEGVYGKEIMDFLEFELTKIERRLLAEKIEQYQKINLFDLRKTEKLKNIDGYNYLRISIGNIRLRLFGSWSGLKFTVIYVFKKKQQRMPLREIRLAKIKINSYENRRI
jgi:phage-related protein